MVIPVTGVAGEFGNGSVLMSTKLFAAKLSLKCSLLILTARQRQVFCALIASLKA